MSGRVSIPRFRGWLLLVAMVTARLLGAEPPAPPVPAATPAPVPPLPLRSTVVAIRDERAISSSLRPDADRVRVMVDRAVMAVTGHGDVASAWRSLVKPNDVVGIKIAAAGGPRGATRKPVVAAIVEGLAAAGVPRAQIVVWDRDEEELRVAGYLAPNAAAGAVVRHIPPRGYDRTVPFTAAVLGRLIWGDLDFVSTSPLAATLPGAAWSEGDAPRPGGRTAGEEDSMSERSYYATILTKKVTKIVNVPTLTDSVYAGVAGCLYNMTLPNIDNWRRFTLVKQYGMTAPRTSADPYVAEIYSDPLIAPRVVLNLIDGLVAQYAGGPEFHPQYCVRHATIYASRDPVALDTIALRTIEQWREQAKMSPAEEGARYLWTAEQIKLGHASLDKIDIRRLTP